MNTLSFSFRRAAISAFLVLTIVGLLASVTEAATLSAGLAGSPMGQLHTFPAIPAGSSVGQLHPFPALPAVRSEPTDPNEIRITGLGKGSTSWTIVVLLTFLTLIPSLLLCMTPFARLLIVFHFLRQALGLQTTPSNQTLIGLSLVLTCFLMQPVGASIYQNVGVALTSRSGYGYGSGRTSLCAGSQIHASLCSGKRCRSLC